MGRRTTNKFSLMNDEELMQYLWGRYQQHGIGGFTFDSMNNDGLYFPLYGKGLNIKKVIKKLGLEEEYNAFKLENFTKSINGRVHRRWSWERIIEEATPIVKTYGFLPPGQWFQKNKLSSLVFSVYKLGKDWNDLRAHFESYETSDFVQSRNGMRWRSHPEASLSNFLYARGIEHKKGEKYPEEYTNYGDASYGYYDLHFKAINTEWIDVEIWGDKPKGHNEEGYQQIRKAKELFNKNNNRFLGIHYGDCYEEDFLEALLEPHIGLIKPYIFDKPTDRVIHTTHWSNADDLIEYCREIAGAQTDGVFPTEEWLRKRGKWQDREGPAYNTVSIYIKTWIGGVRKLRRILGQDKHSTIAWNKEKALYEYGKWYKKHGYIAGKARHRNIQLSDDERRLSQNITHAIEKYAGGTREANRILGIVPRKITKWNRDSILEGYKVLYRKHSMTPTQITYLKPEEQKRLNVSKEDFRLARKLVDRTLSYFDSTKEVYLLLGIEPVDIKTQKRRKKTTTNKKATKQRKR